MINDNENEAGNEKQIAYIRREHKYTKYKMCLIIIMIIGMKQHLSNI